MQLPLRSGTPGAASHVRDAGAALVAVTAVTLLLFPGLVFQGRVLFDRDLALMWQPQVESFVHMVTQGSWPLWDPYVSFGRPLLANPNAQVLYPPTWLNLLVRPERFLTLYVLAHLTLAGVGGALLARRLQLGLGASLLTASSFAASGPLLSLVNAWNHLPAACLLPWACLAAEVALARGRARHAAAWGAVLALQVLGGSPDLALFTAAIGGAWLAWYLATAGSAAVRWRLLRSSGIAAVLALCLSAGLVLPALELARASARWALPAASREAWSTHPLGLAEIASPVPWTELPLATAPRGLLYDGGEPFLRSPYLGLPVLALALLSIAGPRRRGRALLLALLAGFLLLAVGRHSPFYTLVLRVFPPLRSIRYPSKALVAASFAASLLAGMGFDAWRRAGRRQLLALAGGMFLAGLVALGAGHLLLRSPGTLQPAVLMDEAQLGSDPAVILQPLAGRLTTSAILWLAFASVTLARAWRPSAATAAAALAVAALDLVVANRHLNPTAPPDFYRYRPPVAEAVAAADPSRLFVFAYPLRPAPPHPALPTDNPYRIAWYPAGYDLKSGRMLAARLYPMPPAGEAFQLFGSFDADQLGLQPRPLAALRNAFERAEGTPAYRRLLAIGAVTRVLALHERGLEDLTPLVEYRTQFVFPVRLYAVPGALPRTYVVGKARVAGDEEALHLLADPAFDPTREVVLPPGTSLVHDGTSAGSSRVVALDADRVRIEAELDRPGYVILVDGYDPGWQATVDGRPAAVMRANVAFRAVATESGRHRLELVYRPRSVLLGLGCSAGALVVAAGMLLRDRSRPTGVS